jgi:serine/threonine-protein kinase
MLHTTEPVPSVRSLNTAVPVALDEVVKKAMAKDRDDRYPSAVELLSDLRMIQDALRFGRNLTWPIAPAGTPNPSPVPNRPGKTEEKPEPVKRSGRHKVSPMTADDEEPPRVSDVPGWLKWIVVFLVAIVALMIGTYLVFNLKQPKLVAVPELKGLTVAQAEQELKSLKLKLRTMRRQINESTPPDTILDSDPVAKTKLKEGGTVSVVVSAGGQFVEVPDLRGMTVDKARMLLDSLGLQAAANVAEVRDPDVAKGLIVKQSPTFAKRVTRKTEIQLTVSSGNDRPTINPNDHRPYVYTIRIELSNVTEPVRLRVEMTDSRGTRTISDQDRQPGETVELQAEGYGAQAIFSIYYDGELVAQHTKKSNEEAVP